MTDDKISKNEAIDAALHLDGDPQKVRAFYDEWAKNYDIDTTGSGYSGPRIAAKLSFRGMTVTKRGMTVTSCGMTVMGLRAEI